MPDRNLKVLPRRWKCIAYEHVLQSWPTTYLKAIAAGVKCSEILVHCAVDNAAKDVHMVLFKRCKWLLCIW